MSLINKMLRELDVRHAPAVDRKALPRDVRVLPPERRRRPWPVVALLLAVAGASSWYVLSTQTGALPQPQPALPSPPLPATAATRQDVAPSPIQAGESQPVLPPTAPAAPAVQPSVVFAKALPGAVSVKR